MSTCPECNKLIHPIENKDLLISIYKSIVGAPRNDDPKFTIILAELEQKLFFPQHLTFGWQNNPSAQIFFAKLPELDHNNIPVPEYWNFFEIDKFFGFSKEFVFEDSIQLYKEQMNAFEDLLFWAEDLKSLTYYFY